MKRRVTMTVAGLTAAAAIAGCGGGAGSAGKAVGAALTSGKVVGTYVSHAHPNPGTLHEAATGLASVSDDALSIKGKLDRINASDDPLGEALTQATCSGLTQVSEQDQESSGTVLPPTAQDWEAFLNEEVAQYAPPGYEDLIPGRVSQFNNAAQLASISPNAARVYVEACVLGKR